MSAADIAAKLAALATDEACIDGTPMVPLHKDTIREAVDALLSTSSAERGMREALERLLPFLDDLDEGADSIGVYPDTACSQECREAVAAARAALSSKGEG